MSNPKIENLNPSPELRDVLYQLYENLESTDYLVLKFAEGELTEEEFAPIREQRRAWRAEINRLQEGLE